MKVTETAATDFSLLVSRFLDSHQWERALEAACEWLARSPENHSAQMAAAQALLNLERHDEAERHIISALQSNPEDNVACRFLSIVYFHKQNFKKADELIHKAISLDPHDAWHWYHLARMRYEQNAIQLAKTYVKKAQELRPNNAIIANLLGLCENEAAAGGAERQLKHYLRALELDPENALIHNNLGAYYINVEHNFANAEACFRRALFFDPSKPMFRKNLFLTLKHRDRFYRMLQAPRNWAANGWDLLHRTRRNSLLFILSLPLWILGARFFFGLLVLWFMFVWPLQKVYEFLTVGDIRAKAGEIGARRGGILNYRSWPLLVRFAIFAPALIPFWGGVAWLARSGGSDTALGLTVLVVLPGLLWNPTRRMIANYRAKAHTRWQARHFAGLLEPDDEVKKPRWSFFNFFRTPTRNKS